MKKYNLIIIFLAFAILVNGQVLLEKDFDAQNIKDLIVFNFEGDVIISASNDDYISVKVVLEDGKMGENLTLKEFKKGDLFGVYLKTPCMVDPNDVDFNPEQPFKFMNGKNNCDWDNFHIDEMPNITFEISLPASMNVYVSTINDGDIRLENIKGKVHANNVNGGISISNCNRVHEATTVNGNVDVVYRSVPETAGNFKTINGDIELSASSNANVNAHFKSFSGDFYTDFDKIDIDKNMKKETQLKEGKLIKINEYTNVKIGDGGFELAIETFNGNAYLRKK